MNNSLNPGYYTSPELRALGFAAVGTNVFISKHCNIVGSQNIYLASNIRIDYATTIVAGSAGVRIGNYVHIGAYCYLSGGHGITIADFAGLSQRVTIHTSTDDYLGGVFTNPTVPAELTRIHAAAISIGRHAILGSGAVVLPKADIAEGVAIGALSMVNKPTKSWTIYGGVPAKILRARAPIDPDGLMAARLLNGDHEA